MKRLYYLTLLFTFFSFYIGSSANIYVNDGFTTGDVYCSAIGNDANSGLTPALPKRTVAAAITAAAAGDTIYIDSGTYPDDSIGINKALTIIGAGTSKTIFDNANAAQLWANITSSNVVIKNIMMTQYFNATSAQGQVININGAYSGIVLENILITKCLGASSTLPNINISGGANVTIKNSMLKCSGYNGSMGGGILVNNSILNVTNTVFYQNESATATENGGALQVKGASANVTVTNCTFDGCVSLKGGAIGQNAGTLSVTGSCFSNNISETDDNTSGGGAIFVNGTSNTSISNCSFNNNAATNQAQGTGGVIGVGTATSCDGAAICFKTVTGTASVTNCSFSNNGKLYDGTINPFDDGQDIYYSGASLNITIQNNTFSVANSGEVNIFEDGSGNDTISNNGVFTATGTSVAPSSSALIPTRTDVAGFGTWTDSTVTGTTTLSMLSSLVTPLRTDIYSTCSTVVFAGWTDTGITQGATCSNTIGSTGYLNLLTTTSSTISPAMDFTTSSAGKFLTFRARTFGGTNTAANTVTVSISTDNGGTWTTLGTRTPTSTTLTAMTPFDLSSYTGTQVKVRFQSLAATGTIGIGIDDIAITNASTTITPSMDFSNKGVQMVYTQALVGGTNTTLNTIKVSISSDNGATWSTVSTTNTAGTFNVDLSSYHSTTTKVKFESIYANGTTGASLDNISFNYAAGPNSSPATVCANLNGVSKCNAAAVNCATETVSPVILSCVPNKTLPCPAVLPDYRTEVAAYDDCSYTVTQSPVAGTSLNAGNTTVTMTVTDQNNNSTTCTFIVTVAAASAPSNFGEFASAVGISTNGGSSSAFYNTTGSGANLIGASAFTNATLGTFTANSGALKLTGAEFKSWKSGTGNVCGGSFYYLVYPTGARPASPTFQSFSLPWKADCSGAVFTDGLGPCNGNDQKWSTVAQNIDLTTYANGNYTLEVYYLETGSDSGGGCGTNFYINNSCSNFTANFTIGSPCVAPSISSHPSNASYCQNAAATALSVTASGTSLTYQWYSNTVNNNSGGTSLGAGAQTSTYTPLTTSAGTFYYYCVVTGTCGTTTSNVATIVVDPQTVAGTASSDQTICKDNIPAALTLSGNTGNVVKWQKATDAAFTTPVDIASTATTLSSADMGSLTATTYYRAVVKSGTCSELFSNIVTITVPYSTWNGTGWSNGTPTIETTVTFTGNYSSSADLFACSVTVTNNANVVINSGNDYTVYGKVTVDSGSTFEFKNDANLIQVANLQNSGNIIVKRNTIALSRLDYKLWATPVMPQQLLAFSPQTLTNRFYTYNSGISNYSTVAASGNFDLGKGYLIRMPDNFPTYPATNVFNGTFTGVPNNGDIAVTISNTGDKFTSIGNPYPSTINPMTFVTTNSNNITGTLYIWRKRNNTNYLPGYITWAGGTMTGNGEPGTFSGSLDYLQVGQGFLVQSKNDATSVLFNNQMRSGNNGGISFKNSNAIEYNRIWLNLTSTSTTEFNQMAVGYITGATMDVELFDGKNINTTVPVLLCSIINNEEYTIQGRPLPFADTDVVPLLYRVTTAGNYTISIDHVDGLFEGGNQDIFIKDNLTNTYNNLNTSPYTFASDAGTFNNRFELVYRSSALSTNNSTFSSNQVVVYKNNEDIVINSGNIQMAKVKIFDVRGRLLAEKNNINATETKLKASLTNEVLLVQITAIDGTTVVKKIIN